VTELFVNIYHK